MVKEFHSWAVNMSINQWIDVYFVEFEHAIAWIISDRATILKHNWTVTKLKETLAADMIVEH